MLLSPLRGFGLAFTSVLAAPLGCGGRPRSHPPVDEWGSVQRGEVADSEQSPHSHRRLAMAARILALGDARDALVRGRLDDARASLAALAVLPVPPQLPAEGEQGLRAIERAAAEGAQAVDARALAVSVAQIANQCGGCHQTVGASVTLPHPGPGPSILRGDGGPVGEPGMARHMELQQWALDRLWAGLIQPSAEA